MTSSGSSAGATATSPSRPATVGPCAQHAATLLPNGNVLIFDNGSTSFFGNLCVDPAGPCRTGRPPPDDPRRRARPRRTPRRRGRADLRCPPTASRGSWGPPPGRQRQRPDRLVCRPDGAGLRDGSLRRDGVEPGRRARKARDGAGPSPTSATARRWCRRATASTRRSPLDGPADGVVRGAVGAAVPVSYSCADRGGSTFQSCDGPAGRPARHPDDRAPDLDGDRPRRSRSDHHAHASLHRHDGPGAGGEVPARPHPRPRPLPPAPPVAAAGQCRMWPCATGRRDSWVGAGDRRRSSSAGRHHPAVPGARRRRALPMPGDQHRARLTGRFRGAGPDHRSARRGRRDLPRPAGGHARGQWPGEGGGPRCWMSGASLRVQCGSWPPRATAPGRDLLATPAACGPRAAADRPGRRARAPSLTGSQCDVDRTARDAA